MKPISVLRPQAGRLSKHLLLLVSLALGLAAAAGLSATLGYSAPGGQWRVSRLQNLAAAGSLAWSGARPLQAASDVDLSLGKSAALPSVTAGARLTYTLTVTNMDIMTSTGSLLTDTLPAGTSFLSGSAGCSPGAGTVTCSLGALVAGATQPLTIAVAVPASAAGVLTNTASIQGLENDPQPANNTALVTTTVTASADLGLAKAAAPDPVTAGAGQAYTLTVSNNGPSDSAGGVVTDTLPSGVSFLAGSPGCTPSSGLVVCALGALAAGANRPLTLTVAVPASATSALTNTASVLGSDKDADPLNNTAQVTSAVATSADLALVKTASAAAINAGELLTYTLAVTNTGPSDAAAVVVTDTLPAAGITLFPASASQGMCTPLSGQVRCDLGALAAGGQALITVPVQVDSAAASSLQNSAIVAAGTSDPVPGNNSDSTTTPVTASADLSIGKSDNPDPVVAGSGVLTYTLTIDNLGPSEASNVSVGDTLPPGVTLQSAVPSQGTCIGSVTCSLGNLDAGNSSQITITVAVSAGALSPLANGAVVTSITPDPDGSNNATTENTTVVREADLALTKTGSPHPDVTAGTTLIYTLAVTNTGPSDAPLVVLTDTLPAGYSMVSANPSQGNCNSSAGQVVCDLGGLSPSASTSVLLIGAVDQAAAGQLVNRAVVASQASDPTPLDNAAALTTTVSALADLAVAKAGTPNSLPPGGVLTYTLTVTNTGPSRASGVVINDVLPNEVQLKTATPSQGNCSGTNPVTCNFGDLDSGKAASAVLVVDVDSAAPEGPITNIGAALSSTADPDLSNNGDTETTQLSTTIVDLAVAKSESADPAYASSPLVYTLAVSNTGPSNATGVVVSDTLPSGVSLAGTWASQGSCSGGAVVTCPLGGLAAGAQATAVLTVTIDSATTGVILNSASVGGAEADANTANNSSQIVTTVIPQADLELAKTDSPDPVVAGVSALTYTLTVTNRGPSLARGLILTDTLPSGLTLLSTSPPTCSAPPGPVVCSLPDLNAGATAVLTLHTTVDPGASGTLLNQAEVASSAEDPNPGDNIASSVTSVTQDTDPPAVTWTAPVMAGERFDVGAARSVRLEVQAADNLGVEKVRFIRWDAVHNQYVQVGEDFSAPYTWDLDTRTLNPEWNQIFAQAFDLAGNASPPPPAAPFLWLYRWDIFLPLLSR